MPDISMCQNKVCPSRLKCYRYMAMPNPYRQAYRMFAPQEGEAQCEDFLPLYPEHQHMIDKHAAEADGGKTNHDPSPEVRDLIARVREIDEAAAEYLEQHGDGADTLYTAFEWKTTPQGLDYWWHISQQLGEV